MRFLLLALGHLFVVLAFLGIFLPVLPTTPFLILAVACYSRGSEKFEAWIMEHPRFGPQMVEWRSHRIIRPRAKLLAASLMAVSVGLTLRFANVSVFPKVAMIVSVLVVLSYILTRPSTLPDEGSSKVL